MAAPTGSTLSNVSDAIATNYDRKFRGQISWAHGALGGMITKVKAPAITAIPVRSGVSPAVSATFTDAQTIANTQYTKVVKFVPPYVKKYGIAQIDGMIVRTKGEMDLFDEFAGQLDGILDGSMQQFSRDVYGSGYGQYGKISTAQVGASTTVQLQNPEDIVNFNRGQQFFLAASDTAAARSSGALCTITGILDLNAGTFQIAANLATTLSDWAAGDSIYLRGNRGTGASPTPMCLNGLDAWGPITVPGAGVDWATGVDRSNDANLRFQVIDLTTSTKSKEEAVVEAATASARFGGQGDKMMYFTNPTNMKDLVFTGMAKVRPAVMKGPYGIGFSGVTVSTPDNGDIKVAADRFCPVQRSYLLDMTSLKFYGVGDATVPQFIDLDGAGKVLRMTDADAVECRVGYFGYLGCNRPISNVVVVHSTN